MTRARFRCAEPPLQLGAVGALHDEDEVCPFHQLGGAVLLRVRRQAGGGGLDAGPGREHLLGRRGAEAVAGAEEEEVGQIKLSEQRIIARPVAVNVSAGTNWPIQGNSVVARRELAEPVI